MFFGCMVRYVCFIEFVSIDSCELGVSLSVKVVLLWIVFR